MSTTEYAESESSLDDLPTQESPKPDEHDDEQPIDLSTSRWAKRHPKCFYIRDEICSKISKSLAERIDLIQRQLSDINYMMSAHSDNMRELRSDLAEMRDKIKDEGKEKEDTKNFTDDGTGINVPDRVYVVTNTFNLANN
jgi:hypothetical protein